MSVSIDLLVSWCNLEQVRLYVAILRGSSREKLKILITNKDIIVTSNVVYGKVFHNLG